MMEPLDLSTRRGKSPVAICNREISSISPNSLSALTPFNRRQPLSGSEPSNATDRVADQPFCDLKPTPNTLTTLPKSIPFTTVKINSSLYGSSTLLVNNDILSIEKVRSRSSKQHLLPITSATTQNEQSSSQMNPRAMKKNYSSYRDFESSGTFPPVPPGVPFSKGQVNQVMSQYSEKHLLPRNATPVQDVKSSQEMDLSPLKSYSKRPSSPESLLQTIPSRSQHQNSSERKSSGDDVENYINYDRSVNYNVIEKFQNGATSTSPLLMPEVISALSLQALQARLNLIHFYQNNPLFLSTYNNVINQSGINNQPTTPSYIDPNFSLSPYLSVPSTVANHSSIGLNTHPPDLKEDSSSQESLLEFKAKILSNEQVGRKKRRKSLQNPKRRKSDDSGIVSMEDSDSDAPMEDENDRSKMEQVDSSRASSKKAESIRTAGEEGSSLSEADKKSKSISSKKIVKNEAYWRRRRKNNEAVKRSRAAKRAREEAARVKRHS